MNAPVMQQQCARLLRVSTKRVLFVSSKATTNGRRRQSSSSSSAETVASKTSSGSSGFLASALAWYSKRLDTHPILTKGITSGLIGGTGDLLCQSIIDKHEKTEQRLGTAANECDDDTATAALDESPLWWWDGWRTARFVLLGAAFVAPWCHYWYGALAVRYPMGAAATISSSNAQMVFKRVALDQFVFSPIFLVGWITSLWTLENGIMSSNTAIAAADGVVVHDNSETPARLVEAVPDILVANWILWIPVQAVNFRFTPTKFQVLTSNCVALIWNAYLSFSTRTKPASGALDENVSSPQEAS
jgi:Mpv17 / PMP22 family